MPLILLETRIRAPRERVFDLARSIDAHPASTPGTSERAVAGVTSGLIGLGDEVTWRARHLGVTQHLSVRITAFDPPRHFQDRMLRGAFARMCHDHDFVEDSSGDTLMTDRFDFAAPLGPLGRLAEKLFLTRYRRRFLETRNTLLKTLAEGEDWKRHLPAPPP
jgi:ligand-binding SRPBCC domain-containing protein